MSVKRRGINASMGSVNVFDRANIQSLSPPASQQRAKVESPKAKACVGWPPMRDPNIEHGVVNISGYGSYDIARASRFAIMANKSGVALVSTHSSIVAGPASLSTPRLYCSSPTLHIYLIVL